MQIRRYFLIPVLLLCLNAAGCTTYNPATGRQEFILISAQEELDLGAKLHAQIVEEYPLSEDKAAVERLDRIGQRVALVSDRQDMAYKFYLIDKDEMNAFTTPGANIYFYSGLFNKLGTDDRIASVLAHEIGHTAAKHTVKKFQASMGYNLISSILLSQIDAEGARQVADLSSGALMSVVFSSYGRKDEHEADRLAVRYMILAGYDPQAIIETFKVLEEASDDSKVPLFLRSHPYLKDRVTAVQQEIEEARREFE